MKRRSLFAPTSATASFLRHPQNFCGLLSCAAILLLSGARSQADVLPENRALLAFKREQLALSQQLAKGYSGVGQPELEAWIHDVRIRSQQIENATGDAAAVSVLGKNSPLWLEERAYFAANDNSPQGYWIALPRDYSRDKKYSLAVFLHGYAPAISKLSPWLVDDETLVKATSRDMIVAMPYGRRNSDFVQWGEDDVLAVKRECQRIYSIDAARTYLVGASMGGYGAHAVGLHKPDEWAAIAPISGRTDFYLWFKTQRADLPAWKQVLYDADDPRTLIENARSTPYFFQHGALDKTVPVEHSRLFKEDAQRLHLPYLYLEDPNLGHENEFQLPALSRAFEWVNLQQPRSAPRQISFTSGDLREARTDWVQIEAFNDYAAIAHLDAKLEGSTIEVQAQNVARFTLNLKAFTLGTASLEVNKTKVGDFDSAQPISWSAPDAKTGKTPTRCGPFKSLMRGPFTLVYGNDRDKKDAQRFAREWKDSADGTVNVRSARDVSGTEKRESNLILFGTRETNPLLREIADQLPVELRKDGYRVGTAFTAAKNCGLRLIWRSPWSEKNLMGVCSGAWWGDKLPLNHKWDLLPDYIIYQDDVHDKDDTNHAIIAGDFDGDWQIKEAPKAGASAEK